MTGVVIPLMAVLAVWIVACIYCGYKLRIFAFLAVLVAGLALNLCWMVLGLKAHPFEPHALVAQASLAVYGICAFGLGLLIGRAVRRWRATAVDSGEV